VNDIVGGKIDDSISKEAFDQVFKRPSLGQVETGPPFEQLVESVVVKVVGPFDSIEIFSRVCRERRFPVSFVESDDRRKTERRCSTGVSIAVDLPDNEELFSEFEISEEMRRNGRATVMEYSNGWRPYREGFHIWDQSNERSVQEIEAQNVEIRRKNLRIKQENAERLVAPRKCKFSISPIAVAVSIAIIDYWIAAAKPRQPIVVEVELRPEVLVEARVEAISAKIHGSQLSLREDATLLWARRAIITLDGRITKLIADPTTSEEKPTDLSELHIQDLIGTLFELNILSLGAQRGSKRKR
jgi:hypothetical protein